MTTNPANKCPTPPREDLSFSSTSEIKNFIRSRMELPSTDKSNAKAYKFNIEKPFTTHEGRDMFDPPKYAIFRSLIHRTFFNPVDYDGRLFRDIQDAYNTNEIGFFIAVTFFGALGWSVMTYRRATILE